ncbi:hypothetical protein K466DRAFT_344685 [Polyporus arcularius HHB13444]|uniref:Uncharacterized protein n=1 Tax=Polyporus arcularius HHB13444 TaxID=1314778 RepID=A0A5C3PY67_9APHY|nr:hypothetical protein K466DRAFT_344685 [Polyporus arcularius HHB13444]
MTRTRPMRDDVRESGCRTGKLEMVEKSAEGEWFSDSEPPRRVRCVKLSVRLSFTSVFLSATSLFVWSGGTEMTSATAYEVPGRHRGNHRKDLRGGRRGQRSR